LGHSVHHSEFAFLCLLFDVRLSHLINITHTYIVHLRWAHRRLKASASAIESTIVTETPSIATATTHR